MDWLLFVLAITDILNSNSQIIALGEKVISVESTFEKKLEDNMMFLEGVVSRKNNYYQLLIKYLRCNRKIINKEFNVNNFTIL